MSLRPCFLISLPLLCHILTFFLLLLLLLLLLLPCCRSLKVHDRRIRKAAAKQQLSLARRLMSNKPGYKLDHLVKER
jgi:pescadillo protein